MRNILTLSLLFCAIFVNAQRIEFNLKNNQKPNFGINNVSKLIFSENSLQIIEISGSTQSILISDIKKIFFDNSLSFQDNTNMGYSIFPNPFTDFITIQTILSKTSKPEVNVEIIDVNGKKIYRTTATDGSRLNLSMLERAIYICRIHEYQAIKNFRIIKRILQNS